jgi:hypothetical protein
VQSSSVTVAAFVVPIGYAVTLENWTYTESFAQLFLSAFPRNQKWYGTLAAAQNVSSK